jgi:hypothetical protein
MSILKFTAVLLLSASALTLNAQWTPAPTYPSTADRVAEQQAEQRRQQEQRMAEIERQGERDREREQANRPTCTTYHTNPDGTVTARTAPCY